VADHLGDQEAVEACRAPNCDCARREDIPSGACAAEIVTERRSAPATERFFVDHGVWHDRGTGKHLFYEGESPEAATVDEAWAVLAAAGIERDGWRTLPESIAKLAAIARATEGQS
jgi:hypothetical protein